MRAPKRSLWETLRSYWMGPYNLKEPPRDPALRGLYGWGPTSSGVHVTETTALSYAPVWAAVNLIASDIAKLPLFLYRRLPNNKGKERFTGHPLYRMLHDSPNPYATSIKFRRSMQAQALLWGNAYAEIVRDDAQRPRELWQLHPDYVRPLYDDSGRLVYKVRDDQGGEQTYSSGDIIHICGLGIGELGALQPIQVARDSIGMGIAAERFGADFYKNNAHSGGVFMHQGVMNDLQKKGWRESLESIHQGEGKRHRFMLVQGGMTFEHLSIKPNEAQFIESKQFQVTEIARWFNVPAHKINDLLRSTFSNIEQLSIDYYTQTIVPWLETWEQELELKLIAQSERNLQVIEHETEGLLRADSEGRAALQTAEFNQAAITPNEIRLLSNRNAVDGGDVPFVQTSYIPLPFVDRYWEAQIESLKAKANPPAPSGGGEDRATIDRLMRELADTQAQLVAEQHKHAETADVWHAEQVGRLEAEATIGLLRETISIKDVEAAGLRAGLDQAKASNQTLTAERDRARTEKVTAETLAEERGETAAALAEQLANVTAARDEAVTSVGHLVELLDGSQAALEASEAELARQLDAHQQTIREAEGVAGELEAVKQAATKRYDEVVAERDEMNAARVAAEAALSAEQAERTRYVEQTDGHISDIESLLGAASEARMRAEAQEREARSERDELKAAREAAETIAAALTAEYDERIATLENEANMARAATEVEAFNAGEARAAWRDITAAHGAERAAREAAEAETEALRATVDDLGKSHEATIADLRQKLADADLAFNEANESIGKYDADHAREKARAEAAEAARDEALAKLTEQRKAEVKRLAAMLSANRALIAHTVREDIVLGEIERVRRNHGTQQKLLAWIDRYYPNAEEGLIESLLPAIRVHLTWQQSEDDPRTVAKSYVKAHIAESVRQLRSVAGAHESEWQSELSHMLTRWETDRPEAVADLILREELEYVRSIQS